MMDDTDQCRTHLNSLWFLFVREGRGTGCSPFRMVLCVGCLGGTVLYVRIEYRISQYVSCERSGR